ncbi:hypothetical protein BSKO_04374 [Bryopsis sp. KO-2023]|nr:hypothetical protein BSKO_04374 [Bryopsis sp. KO-2023]
MASLQNAQNVKSFTQSVGGQALQGKSTTSRLPASRPMRLVTTNATVKLKAPSSKKTGTMKVQPTSSKTKSIELFSKLSLGKKKGTYRTKEVGKAAPKLLSSIEQLKLLSKLEQAGLLSKIEKSGLTLSKIESLGLLSTAEKLGLLSAANDRSTPGAVFTLAFILLAAAPALVFLLPDSSPALVYGQYVAAGVAALGGAAAFGGATFLSKLQQK